MSGFAKGADVSWITEMEQNGKKFYNADGKATECMTLLRDLGMNSIRLRVWVNPEDGWNGKNDVVAKAWRAQQLGMRLMIDFHYSDTWADPSKQGVPAAWKNNDFEQMKQAVADHTKDVLNALKERGVNVEWVQVGNETTDGMLWNDEDGDAALKETGRASKNMANFAAYINAGYDAVKAIYPEAKVIVHLDKGNNLSQYTWMFDGLKQNGAKWDVIGMSLYPDWIPTRLGSRFLMTVSATSRPFPANTTAMSSSQRSVWCGIQKMPLHSSRRWWMAARQSLHARACSTGSLSATVAGTATTRVPSTTAASLLQLSMLSSRA